MKKPEAFQVVVDRGAEGYTAAWCLNFPGCYALVAPGDDVHERMRVAILEFAAWVHNRSADRLDVSDEALEIVQATNTGDAVRFGESSAFFLFDAQPVTPREFPGWANAHDLAHDDLQQVALSMPPQVLAERLDGSGRTMLNALAHAAAVESLFGAALDPSRPPLLPREGPRVLEDLREAHLKLQETVCGVPPGLRTHRQAHPGAAAEEWSVRKVMRRSIWHLRYHTWELRRAMSSIWLG